MATILGAGVASSLGRLAQAAAAFRAGVVRFRSARDFELFERGDDAPQPAIISPAGETTFGFSGIGGLVALAMAALRDLGARPGIDLVALVRDGICCLALPDPWSRGIRASFDGDDDEEARIRWLGDAVAKQAFANLGLPFAGCRCYGGGRIAAPRACAAASSALASGEAPAALVLAIDSLVAPACLELLLEDQLLRTRAKPMGFCPGEAGVALALGPASGGGTGIALDGFAFVEGSGDPESTTPPDGRAGAESLLASIAVGAPAESACRVVIVDHSGGVADAYEWGGALIHLAAKGVAVDRLVAWYPAAGFGEVGAAFGALSTCLAMRGIQRGYAPSQRIAIKVTGPRGARAGMAVMRNDTQAGGA